MHNLVIGIALLASTTQASSTIINKIIASSSDYYEVSSDKVTSVLTCESGLNPNAVGDNGHSFGLAQIYMPAHPEITKEQALDPYFAVDYLASQMPKGHGRMWTCYRQLYGII